MKVDVRRLRSQWFQVKRRLQYGLPYKANIPGTARWLSDRENAYGGYHRNVPRYKIGRSLDGSEVPTAGMIGGDRMGADFHRHAYGPFYEKVMRQFIGCSVTLVEIGILRGVGLAIWSDLFPTGRIIGLDIDLSHFRQNLPDLRNQGAFSNNNVEVHEFDQTDCGPERLGKILGHTNVDIVIDDGMHTRDAISNTYDAMQHSLKQKFLYVVEDSHDAVDVLPIDRRRHRIIQEGEICAILPREVCFSNK